MTGHIAEMESSQSQQNDAVVLLMYNCRVFSKSQSPNSSNGVFMLISSGRLI